MIVIDIELRETPQSMNVVFEVDGIELTDHEAEKTAHLYTGIYDFITRFSRDRPLPVKILSPLPPPTSFE
jgi:hypothetical protein